VTAMPGFAVTNFDASNTNFAGFVFEYEITS